MFPLTPGGSSFTVALADEQATQRLMLDIAALIEPGDLITLSGDLGAGKTTFARALIRHLAGDETIEVPSPTFTLMQAYELPRFAAGACRSLPAVGPGRTCRARLRGHRRARRGAAGMAGPRRGLPARRPARRRAHACRRSTARPSATRASPATARLPRAPSASPPSAAFSTATALPAPRAGASRATPRRAPTSGSPSTAKPAILMNSPRRPDGPPVRDGKPYSAIAHLAENVTPFVAMALALRERGFSAPAIIAADRDAGLLILEDLGDEPVVAGNPPAPIEARYEVAVDVLVALHGMQLPDVLPVEPGVDYRLPRYDMEALLIEAELLLDWYLPRLGAKLSDLDARGLSRAVARRAAVRRSRPRPPGCCATYHSPNLLWLPQREGVARVGLLDFQDAMVGPAAYDLASLLHGCPRRRAGDDGDRAALPLHARPARRRSRLRRAAFRQDLRHAWLPSAPPRFSAFSPGSTPATASRNIYVTCRGYGPTCSVRWRIRRWCRLPPGTPSTCRR